jgi:signal peptidase I
MGKGVVLFLFLSVFQAFAQNPLATCESPVADRSTEAFAAKPKAPRRWGRTFVLTGAAAYFAFRTLVMPISIQGHSMEPTYHHRSLNFVNRISNLYRELQHGDVVVVREVENSSALIIKRIVAFPGEEVAIKEGHLFVNGERHLDAFSNQVISAVDGTSGQIVPAEFPNFRLGPEEFFVIGDNRSRTVYLTVNRKQILGTVVK